MTISLVQRANRTVASSSSATFTLSTAPVSGNLLVIRHYAGGANQGAGNQAGPSGFATACATTDTTSGGFGIYWKISDGTEGTSPVVTSNGAVYHHAVFDEWSSDVAWAVNPLDLATPISTTGESVALTQSGANALPNELVLAGFGLSGAATIGNTWTNGFTQDYVSSDTRLEAASKQSTAIETSSTTETWVTSRTVRGGVASFKIPGVQPPTNLAVSVISATALDVTWTAASGATGYDVYRGTTNVFGSATLIASEHPASPYHDTGLTTGQAYYYWVRSVA